MSAPILIKEFCQGKTKEEAVADMMQYIPDDSTPDTLACREQYLREIEEYFLVPEEDRSRAIKDGILKAKFQKSLVKGVSPRRIRRHYGVTLEGYNKIMGIAKTSL